MTQTPPTPQAGGTGDPQPQAGDTTTTPTPQAGAGKTPEDYERMITQLRAENAANRVKLKKHEDDEALRAAAQMSELERAQKAAADSQEQIELQVAQIYELLVYQDVARHFRTFDFIDGISSELIADMLLLKDDDIKFEDGKPTNIKELLEKLVKAQPGLQKPAGQQQQRAPATPGMNPGRSNITPPGAGVPGRIPRLSDPGIWNKK